MKHSIQISKFGGPEVFKPVDLESPQLLPHEVRIQVAASGINFADIMMRIGTYPEAPKPPFVPGYEIAGKVLEVGKEVKTIKPGDRVLAGTRFGGYTSEINLPEYQVKIIPNHLTDVQAAAIPVNFLTAWVALQDMARVRKGDRVLIQSAAGGVGLAAVQIAHQMGAHVTGLVGSLAKAETPKSLGADLIITNSDWDSSSDQDRGEFDIILDATGGESLKRSYRRLTATGRVITFGVSSIVSGKKRSFSKLISLATHTFIFTPFKLMMDNKGVFGLNMLQLFEEPKPGKYNPIFHAMDCILERFSDRSYQVVVGKTFPLDQAGEAQTYLQSRSNIGKVILTS